MWKHSQERKNKFERSSKRNRESFATRTYHHLNRVIHGGKIKEGKKQKKKNEGERKTQRGREGDREGKKTVKNIPQEEQELQHHDQGLRIRETRRIRPRSLRLLPLLLLLWGRSDSRRVQGTQRRKEETPSPSLANPRFPKQARAADRRRGWWRNLLEWRNYRKWKETRLNDRRNYKPEVAKGGSEELKEIERDGNWRTSPSLFKQPQFSHPSSRCKNGNNRWMVSSHSSISKAFVCKIVRRWVISTGYPLTAQRMINCRPLWPLPITKHLLTTSWMTSFHLEGWCQS